MTVSDQSKPAPDDKPWLWEEARWRALTEKVRAGRSLKPARWKDGARVAVMGRRADVLEAFAKSLALRGQAVKEAAVLFDALGKAFVELDAGTGVALRDVQVTSSVLTDLAFDPTTGVLYGSTGNMGSNSPRHLLTIDVATARSTCTSVRGDWTSWISSRPTGKYCPSTSTST